jgi:hypothetical protein
MASVWFRATQIFLQSFCTGSDLFEPISRSPPSSSRPAALRLLVMTSDGP